MERPRRVCTRCSYPLPESASVCPECGSAGGAEVPRWPLRKRILVVRLVAAAVFLVALGGTVFVAYLLADFRSQVMPPPMPPDKVLLRQILYSEITVVACSVVASVAAIAGISLPWLLRVHEVGRGPGLTVR